MAQFVIKHRDMSADRYISHIGTRRNYTEELVYAMVFRSRVEAERVATADERVCLLAEESVYQ